MLRHARGCSCPRLRNGGPVIRPDKVSVVCRRRWERETGEASTLTQVMVGAPGALNRKWLLPPLPPLAQHAATMIHGSNVSPISFRRSSRIKAYVWLSLCPSVHRSGRQKIAVIAIANLYSAYKRDCFEAPL